ncbi:hypothetical protein MMC26_007069 [Xylographa opegraphella]|nr:hypothetical protein [Xylographa opegraphella]
MAPTRQLYTTTTTVFVGPPSIQQTFTAHTLILTSSSRFFAAAFSPSSIFIEAAAKSVSLPEVCPRVFSFWLQWAYSRNLAHEEVDWDAGLPSSPPITPHRITGGTSTTNNENNTASTAGKRPPRHVAFFHLIRLYKLAGFLGCEELRNAIIDEIARLAVKRNAVPGPDDTFELWGVEYEAGKLRELVLDMFVGMRTERLLLEAKDEWVSPTCAYLAINITSSPAPQPHTVNTAPQPIPRIKFPQYIKLLTTTMPLSQRTFPLLRSSLAPRCPTTHHPTRLVRFASVKIDQTKKNNDPSQPQEESHKAQASETDSDKVDKAHPAQQPDPQKEPSRTTGIEKEGAVGVKAGRGKE